MKKTLLFAVLSFAFYGNSQMTQANEATVGTTASMYLCDSNVVTLEAVTGTGVTWDYSDIAGYSGEQRDVEVLAAASTPNAASFSGAEKAIKVGNKVTTYYSSTATERISQGFVFNEPTLGDVLAKFSTDPEQVASYPFGYGNNVDDVFSGEVTYLVAQTVSANGSGHASIDGEGTLVVGTNSIPNVIRYKLVDTSWATITVPIPFGDAEFIRTQYEYYDYANSNLPIFIHSTITVQQAGATNPTSKQSLVLSLHEPDGYLGVDKADAVKFSVYPNPATNVVTISGELSGEAKVDVLDQSGRVILSTSIVNNDTIDISSLEDGAYFVRVENNGLTTTKSIVKK